MRFWRVNCFVKRTTKIMKKIPLFFMLAMLALPTFAKGPKTETVKIKTSAICEMCKERIERNLSLTKGISEAVLNLDDKVATVVFNPKKTNVEKIKKAIAEIGYDADELTADAKGYNKLPSCCKKDGHKMTH